MWLGAGLCCLLWGSAFPSIKTGYKLFEIEEGATAGIILFAGIRFFLAGVLSVIVFSLIERKPLLPEKGSAKGICVLSLFQTVLQYVFFYLGLAFTTGARASVISSVSVFFALLLSAFVFRYEKLKFNKILGCVIGFVGVIVISLDAFKGSAGFKGEAFILLSSLAYAFSSNFMKKYSRDYSPAMLSGWQFILGGAVMSALAFALGGRINAPSAKGVLLLLYLGFLSAAAYSLWSILLKYNEVSSVAVCSFMTPVFGYFLSAIFIKDEKSFSLLSLLSLVLVVIGMITVNKNMLNKKN